MVQVSNRKLDPKIESQITESLTTLVRDLNNTSDTNKFLDSVLSGNEKLMISKRIAAAFLLRHNIQSPDIQEILKLTQSTIFRLKLWIETHQEGFDIVFSKLEKQRRNDAAKTILYKLLNYAINAAAGKVPKL